MHAPFTWNIDICGPIPSFMCKRPNPPIMFISVVLQMLSLLTFKHVQYTTWHRWQTCSIFVTEHLESNGIGRHTWNNDILYMLNEMRLKNLLDVQKIQIFSHLSVRNCTTFSEESLIL